MERATSRETRRSAASSRVVSLPERAASISAGSTPPGPHSSAVPFMGGNETRVVAKKKRSDSPSHALVSLETIREESFSHQNDLSRRTIPYKTKIREYRNKFISHKKLKKDGGSISTIL